MFYYWREIMERDLENRTAIKCCAMIDKNASESLTVVKYKLTYWIFYEEIELCVGYKEGLRIRRTWHQMWTTKNVKDRYTDDKWWCRLIEGFYVSKNRTAYNKGCCVAESNKGFQNETNDALSLHEVLILKSIKSER